MQKLLNLQKSKLQLKIQVTNMLINENKLFLKIYNYNFIILNKIYYFI